MAERLSNAASRVLEGYRRDGAIRASSSYEIQIEGGNIQPFVDDELIFNWAATGENIPQLYLMLNGQLEAEIPSVGSYRYTVHSIEPVHIQIVSHGGAVQKTLTYRPQIIPPRIKLFALSATKLWQDDRPLTVQWSVANAETITLLIDPGSNNEIAISLPTPEGEALIPELGLGKHKVLLQVRSRHADTSERALIEQNLWVKIKKRPPVINLTSSTICPKIGEEVTIQWSVDGQAPNDIITLMEGDKLIRQDLEPTGQLKMNFSSDEQVTLKLLAGKHFGVVVLTPDFVIPKVNQFHRSGGNEFFQDEISTIQYSLENAIHARIVLDKGYEHAQEVILDPVGNLVELPPLALGSHSLTLEILSEDHALTSRASASSEITLYSSCRPPGLNVIPRSTSIFEGEEAIYDVTIANTNDVSNVSLSMYFGDHKYSMDLPLEEAFSVAVIPSFGKSKVTITAEGPGGVHQEEFEITVSLPETTIRLNTSTEAVYEFSKASIEWDIQGSIDAIELKVGNDSFQTEICGSLSLFIEDNPINISMIVFRKDGTKREKAISIAPQKRSLPSMQDLGLLPSFDDLL